MQQFVLKHETVLTYNRSLKAAHQLADVFSGKKTDERIKSVAIAFAHLSEGLAILAYTRVIMNEKFYPMPVTIHNHVSHELHIIHKTKQWLQIFTNIKETQ